MERCKAGLRPLAALLVAWLSLAAFGLAQEDGAEDLTIWGLEVEKLLNLGGALLSVALFALTAIAFRRTGRRKLAYVSAAFLLFALKGLMLASELLFGDLGWIDPVTSALDLAILLSFFVGVVKK